MSIPFWRAASNNLAHTRLVLSPGHTRRGGLVWCALVIAALLIGAAGSYVYWREQLLPLQAQAAALQDLPQLQHALEQSRLQMRVLEARSAELERQIDALNQRLRECQDDLAFYRKARDTKH